MDAKIVSQLRKKFTITNRKTYEPSNIQNIKNNNLLISLIIGFIDGDGCIRKLNNRQDCNIRVKCHKSWLNNLQFMADTINSLASTKEIIARINNSGYAEFIISNSVAIKCLKRKALSLKLPILKRKWNNINLSLVSRNERAIIKKNKIKNLLQKGYSITRISKILKIPYITTYECIIKNNFVYIKEKPGKKTKIIT